MGNKRLDEEVREFLDRWNRAILDKDGAAAAELREEGYTSALSHGTVITREQELAMITSPEYTVDSITTENVEARGHGNEATVVFDSLLGGEFRNERVKDLYTYTLSLRKTGGAWRARSSRLSIQDEWGTQPSDDASGERRAQTRGRSGVASRAVSALGAWLPRPVKSRVKRAVKSLSAEPPPTFPELAYVPYKPGLDFVLPPHQGGDSDAVPAELPFPPKELWLGYNYPKHGAAHVAKLLEIVYASGFSFREGDRILDLGCGAGRMIRHLKDLAGTCEIWGTDISAEHIYWCKQNLSPPFNFATTTKVPHLPFEDGSFRLIYCGSVFTHIDDLADAWLLELRRILAPEGRLYVTIHDEHTVELYEGGGHDHAPVVRWVKSREVYQRAKGSFGKLVLGRDNDSQVFYDTAYFSKTVRPMFDILSITPEAYFYQTAFLLQRKQPPGG